MDVAPQKPTMSTWLDCEAHSGCPHREADSDVPADPSPPRRDWTEVGLLTALPESPVGESS